MLCKPIQKAKKGGRGGNRQEGKAPATIEG